jgi:5-methylcytosine-specific restriction endonuclease McrA
MPKKKKVIRPVYERLGVVGLDEILPFIPIAGNKNGLKKKKYFNKHVKLTSHRYKVYALNGTECVSCELTGTFFALEKSVSQHTDKFHFNLYAINKKSEEVMITIDHITPRAKGGSEALSNKQPMCFNCNNKKGDKFETK